MECRIGLAKRPADQLPSRALAKASEWPVIGATRSHLYGRGRAYIDTSSSRKGEEIQTQLLRNEWEEFPFPTVKFSFQSELSFPRYA
eukprot:scaffold2260_cov212-Pinguiococcus_pyrenoidosus.AAC.3